jgi:hypothetical protein
MCLPGKTPSAPSEMNTMSQEAGDTGSETGGPMWGRFFDSIGIGETESMVSGDTKTVFDSRIMGGCIPLKFRQVLYVMGPGK